MRTYLDIFKEICGIPHGSGNTKAISDYCAAFARARGLRVIQEPCNNVIIFVPGTPGYEAHLPVMIQGHMDMVCAQTVNCPLDMARDGLRLRDDGEWLWAEGTTLGADDGIAVAYALALTDSDVPHPPLEIVLTVEEETGMDGAHALNPAPLHARTLLNLDSEAEGVLTVGCAGGCRADIRWNASRNDAGGSAIRVVVDGLRGGHSGAEIHLGRGNANILLAKLLAAVGALRLVSVSGGSKDNVIPGRAEAVVRVPDAAAACRAVSELGAAMQAEFAEADPALRILAEPVDTSEPAFSEADSAQIIAMLSTQPNGVQQMCPDIPGLVQTSLNLGTLHSDASGVTATVSLRSSVNAEKDALAARLADAAQAHGAQIAFHGAYPAWEFRADSPLREQITHCFTALYGHAPKVEVIHAGLECGLLSEKLPGLDAVSMGPEICDIHTPRERLSLASAERTWQLVCRVLRAL